MVSIDAQLEVIKRNPKELLERQAILNLCRQFEYWPEADGKLDPMTLIGLFMQQITAGNVSCDQVRLMGHDAFTASAYCQARMRLPLGVIQALARQTYQTLADPIDHQEQYLWHGHRVLLIDGTSFSMPDTATLQKHFGQPGQQKEGCGFPVAHLLMLFNARTGLAVDAITAPLRTHEMSQASNTHQHLSAGDLVVGDDSFGTYSHLALLSARGAYGLFPAHHLRIVDFTPNRPCIEPRKAAKAKDAKGLPRQNQRGRESLMGQNQRGRESLMGLTRCRPRGRSVDSRPNQRGRESLMGLTRCRPRGRSVDSRLSLRAVALCQAGSP